VVVSEESGVENTLVKREEDLSLSQALEGRVLPEKKNFAHQTPKSSGVSTLIKQI